MGTNLFGHLPQCGHCPHAGRVGSGYHAMEEQKTSSAEGQSDVLLTGSGVYSTGQDSIDHNPQRTLAAKPLPLMNAVFN